MSTAHMNRRAFLKSSGVAGGGLMLALTVPTGALLAEELGMLVGSAELNVYVKVASDGKITILSANPEIGQGIKTALPMIVAEEMGARWADVVVEQSEVDGKRYGAEFAGGSTNIPRSFDLMRTMGASAREMLISAASDAMELPRSELRARDSQVVHLFGSLEPQRLGPKPTQEYRARAEQCTYEETTRQEMQTSYESRFGILNGE